MNAPMHTVTVRHNFETGHRLPHLEGKCRSLHGHSWWVEATFATWTLHQGIALEFAQAKHFLRGWVDEHLDHGLVLGGDDPLVDGFKEIGYTGKVHVLPSGSWPTVEHMAEYLANVCTGFCQDLNDDPHRGDLPTVRVLRTTVKETHVNAATWEVR